MIRWTVAATSTLILALFAGPAAAQLTVIGGVGVSNPLGDFADVAGSGYHGRLGVAIGLPMIPVSIRVDGDYHTFEDENVTFDAPSVATAGLGVVFDLPGVGIVPYMLGGVDRARLAYDDSVRRFRNGYHVGFGVDVGALAFGGFAEIRLVRVEGGDGIPDTTIVPVSVGIRF